ncbi:MAG: hypothetical protein D6693_03580 [Planctomycetota bacterium]|nr:MAG: hypothetical protein D6693_03580 [Planctomycetota bacterium]
MERVGRLFADAVLGGLELARMALATRLRLRGRYWRWRWHTAFGRGRPRSRRELARRLLAYGRWARSIRRMAR